MTVNRISGVMRKSQWRSVDVESQSLIHLSWLLVSRPCPVNMDVLVEVFSIVQQESVKPFYITVGKSRQ